MTDLTRPTKKQRELLSFIDGFIKGNGYGPSYREVMRALDYKSVSTVATHIDGLITRGYLHKRNNSARSLELVLGTDKPGDKSVIDEHIQWLLAEVAERLEAATAAADRTALLRTVELITGVEQAELLHQRTLDSSK